MFDRRSVLLGLIASAAAPAALARTAFQTGAGTGADDAALLEALDAAFMEAARTSPESLTGLGLKERYGELDDYTPEGAAASLALAERQAADIAARFGRGKAVEKEIALTLRAFGRFGDLATTDGGKTFQLRQVA